MQNPQESTDCFKKNCFAAVQHAKQPPCAQILFFLSTVYEACKGNAVSRAYMNSCIRYFVSAKGNTMDLGSGKTPRYNSILKKNLEKIILSEARNTARPFTYIRCDGNPANEPDSLINFEKTLPFADGSADTILCFNVLEHVFAYGFFTREIFRILSKSGNAYFYIPFGVKIHGSPDDYFRYTDSALLRIFHDAGFVHVSIFHDGGLFFQLCELFNWMCIGRLGLVFFPVFSVLKIIDSGIDFLSRKKYRKSLPYGFFVICKK